MSMNRINSYLREHFHVEVKEVSCRIKEHKDGLFSAPGGSYFFKPLGASTLYEVKGSAAVIEAQRQPICEVLELLLDGWVSDQHRSDVLSALEIQLLQQVDQGKKILPFRKRPTLRMTLRQAVAATPPYHPVKPPQRHQLLLGEPRDALLIGQEVQHLLRHAFLLRITQPEEWLDLLNSQTAPLTRTTVLVELEKFPPKSFLIKESGKILGQDSFLLIQSQFTKKLLQLPHGIQKFLVVHGDLRKRFTYKYLKDCARQALGMPLLHRYGTPLQHHNHLPI